MYNSLILAVASSLAATVLGTAAAVGIDTMRNKWLKSSVLSVTNIPMMNPEIVTGISMMLLFVFAGKLLGARDVLGFWTLLFAHITFRRRKIWAVRRHAPFFRLFYPVSCPVSSLGW